MARWVVSGWRRVPAPPPRMMASIWSMEWEGCDERRGGVTYEPGRAYRQKSALLKRHHATTPPSEGRRLRLPLR